MRACACELVRTDLQDDSRRKKWGKQPCKCGDAGRGGQAEIVARVREENNGLLFLMGNERVIDR